MGDEEAAARSEAEAKQILEEIQERESGRDATGKSPLALLCEMF